MSPFRLAVFSLHKWVGFVLAVYFFAIFATGTFLVFNGDIDALMHPGSLGTESQESPDTAFVKYYETLTKHEDVRVIARINRPDTLGGDFASVWDGNGKRFKVWLDPEHYGSQAKRADPGFVEYVRSFHDHLFVPLKIVYLALTATSFLLLALVLAGLTSYRRFWRGFFRSPGKDETLRNRRGSWHRLIGLWSAPFLLVIALTGIVYFLDGLGAIPVENKSPPARDAALAQATISPETISRAIRVATNEIPDLDIHELALPYIAGERFRVIGAVAEHGYFSTVTVEVHPETFEIYHVDVMASRGITSLSLRLNEFIHFGHWGGRLSQWLWLSFGVLACTLVAYGMGVRLARSSSDGTKQSKPGLLGQLGVFAYLYGLFLLALIAAFVMRFVF